MNKQNYFGGIIILPSPEEVLNSKSSSLIADYLRTKIGLNIFPIKSGTKEPDLNSLKEFFTKKCDLPISDNQSIGILHGQISGTFAIDLDHPNIIKEIFNDPNLILDKTLVVKTPKRGFHIIYRTKNGLLPPKNLKLFNTEGKEIDIKTQGGYTLLPPSSHDEVNGNYLFVSKTLEPFPVDPKSILDMLSQFGYYEESVLRKKFDNEAQNNYNNWTLNQLSRGVFEQGERRRKQNSYYIKLRMNGKPEEEARSEILRVNQTCKPKPLTLREVDYNIDHAELFYQDIKHNNKKPNPNNSIDTHTDYAIQIMNNFNFKTLRETDEILIYKNGVYVNEIAESIIREECEKKIENCTSNICNEVISTIRRRTYVSRHDFDWDIQTINLKNGLLKIENLEFKKHTPNYLSRVQLPINYKPEATPIKFIRFLKTCLPNAKQAYTVMEAFALCLWRTSRFEKAFMFIGEGANGKSTFLEIMQAVLGTENISNVSIHDLTIQRFTKAELEGKLANIYADIESDELRNTGVLKNMISGDSMLVEKKNKNPFKMKNTSKLFFSANRFPEVLDQSNAMFRRFIIIDWIVSFLKKRNTRLKDSIIKDQNELSGILNILIRLAGPLWKRGRLKYEQDVEELRKSWNEKSDPIRKFIEDYVVPGEDYWVEKSALYTDYIRFCGENQILNESAKYFNSRIIDLSNMQDSQKRINGENTRVWKGGTLRKRLRKYNQVELK